MDLTRHQLSEGRANIKKSFFFALKWFVLVFGDASTLLFVLSHRFLRFLLQPNYTSSIETMKPIRNHAHNFRVYWISHFLRFSSAKKLLSLSHSCPLVHIPFCRIISFHFFRLLCAIRCPSSISFACYSLEMMNEGCSEWEMKTWSFPELEKNGRVKKM